MIRLLLVLLILCGTLYLLLFRQPAKEEPELIYRESLEKAGNLEQQMLKDAEDRLKKADDMSQ